MGIVPSTLKRALPRGDARPARTAAPRPGADKPEGDRAAYRKAPGGEDKAGAAGPDPHPWSSVEDLAVESLPSSSSATYEKIAIGCFVISQPYVALQAISHWFKRLVLQKK